MAKKNENADYIEDVLFKDNGKYKDPLVVVLNGKVYRYERGIKHKFPKDVYEIIKRSEAQDIKTARMMEAKENAWAEKARNL